MKSLSYIASIVLTIAFLAVSWWMLTTYGTGDKGWEHAVVVYNALTSIAFTAVGVLLGAKVQEVHVDKAKAEAASANEKSAQKTAAIRTALSQLESRGGGSDEAGGGAGAISVARSTLLQALS